MLNEDLRDPWLLQDQAEHELLLAEDADDLLQPSVLSFFNFNAFGPRRTRPRRTDRVTSTWSTFTVSNLPKPR